MAKDRFYIGPYDTQSGLTNNVKPFLIPDSAFDKLNNAYVFRGRVRKRFGSKWMANTSLSSRLRILIGTTDGSGNISTVVPLSAPFTPAADLAIGQMFSIGTSLFTVTMVANLAPTPNPLLRSDGIVATADYYSTGDVVISGSLANTDVYFYPSLPVMGLPLYERDTVNNELTIAFDTRFAYQFINNVGWTRLAGETTTNAAIWTGSDSQFVWATTWISDPFTKIFFVTNFNENEPNFMRQFNGTVWDNFRPLITAANTLDSARILVPFKNRLVALNTWENEGGTLRHYPQRVRYSQIGSPLAVDAWRQDIKGKGNALDCATTEAIVTVEFVRDRLIVFFERSTWELAYTGNQAQPFTWQQINTELGAESTFSVVPFDSVALGIGNTGIHACSGTNVQRIDDKIPNEVFKFHNDGQGVFRVYGIRDYNVEMVYWTVPTQDQPDGFNFPNRVLVYNYKAGTWSFNDDSFTCFGYFFPETGVTWDSQTVTWDDDESWGAGQLQSRNQTILAGNQEGYVVIVDAGTRDNTPALQITNMVVGANNVVTITAINHNLVQGDYIYLQDIVASSNLTLLNNRIFRVDETNPVTINSFSIVFDTLPALANGYLGGGVMARVSNIQINTKEYNFYAEQGRNAQVSKVNFMMDRTDTGRILVDFYVSTVANSMVDASDSTTGNGSLIGTSVLETSPYALVPFEAEAVRVWHPVYIQADGEVIQIVMSMNDEMMRDTTLRSQPFVMHAFLVEATPTADSFR